MAHALHWPASVLVDLPGQLTERQADETDFTWRQRQCQRQQLRLRQTLMATFVGAYMVDCTTTSARPNAACGAFAMLAIRASGSGSFRVMPRPRRWQRT